MNQRRIQDFPEGDTNPQSAIITGRNEVVAKVMFLLVSVILFTGGGCLPQCMLGYHTPREQTPLKQTTPGADIPLEQTLPWSRQPPRADNPPRADPPEQSPPWSRHTPLPEADSGIWSMSGWYAFYWKAFLFCKFFAENCIKIKEFGPPGSTCPLDLLMQ